MVLKSDAGKRRLTKGRTAGQSRVLRAYGPATVPPAAISPARLARAFEASREGVLFVDAASRKITDVNPCMLEFLGRSYHELVGRELWEIGLLKDRFVTRRMFAQLRIRPFLQYEDLTLETAKGRPRIVQLVANLYPEDRRQTVQCILYDITARKLLERELAAVKDELHRRAASLERALADRTEELRETMGELEALAYAISHDMRAPLRAIRGFAEIVLQENASQLNAMGTTYLNKIDSAAARLDRLIQDVLSYTGVLRAEVKGEPVDLDALVRQVMSIYPQLSANHAEIKIEGVLPRVLGSEARLAQCIANLLTNAIKFVAPGTRPRVKVRAESAGDAVRLWVVDNGVGVEPKDQLRIFKLFERVNRAEDFDGTGMGLPVVKKAVERMGGHCGVESEVGRGSRFWIQLKRANV